MFGTMVVYDVYVSTQALDCIQYDVWERSGSVVECLTRDRRAAGSSLTASLRCGP